MNIINVGDPRTISLLAGQTISVTTMGTITATCVSGLGLTAGATIGSTNGSTVFGSYSVDGAIKLTATNRDGAYELNTDTSETIKSVTGTTGLDVLDAGSRGAVDRSLRAVPYTGALKKLGATAHDICLTTTTVGVTSTTHSIEPDYPRFSTMTRKVNIAANSAQIRFSNLTALADPDDQLISIDVYIPWHPDEFGTTRYPTTTNPIIDVRLSNTNNGYTNSDNFSFSATFLRQGWNTLKMWGGDTVSATAGAGTLQYGCSKIRSGTGVNMLANIQFVEIVFTGMNGKTVYIDQIRRAAKARTKLVMGFDASGASYDDRVFPDQVAPLFAQYGQTGYTTMTNIYEMLFSGAQSWERQVELFDDWGWDVINHTWSHGGSTVGRNQVVTASRTSNVVTAVAGSAHNIPVGTTFYAAIRGSQDGAANGVVKCTVTTTTNFTYSSTGADGAIAGTITWCEFLSEVFATDTAETRALCTHEIADMSKQMRGVGFGRSAHILAYPNNMVPELSVLQYACTAGGVKLARGCRGGTTQHNEFGIDNPLNFGSYEMGSGATAVTVTQMKDHIAGAIGRGEHIWTYGHYILDEATLLPTVVDLEHPPSSGGNPAPPAASESGTGGWWYVGQIRRLLEEAVGPAIAAGNLELMSPTQFARFVGAET